MKLSYLFTAAIAAFSVSLSTSACTGADSRAASSSATDSVASDTTATEIVRQQLPDTLSLAMAGDIMMGTTYPDSMRGAYLPANDGRDLLKDAAPIFKSANLALANLEGTLLDGPGQRRPMGRNPKYYFVFRTPTRYVRNLVDAGLDFMGMANNHVNDFGPDGRKSTLATLKEAGIASAGLKGVNEIALINVATRQGADSMLVAVTQFSHGANTLDINNIDLLRQTVKTMREKAPMAIVAFHGGAEGTSALHLPDGPETYVGEARGSLRKFAHAAIDAGAAIVYGHGPHVPRAIELYKGHLIIYSLGNFCTPYRMGLSGATGLAPIITANLDPETGRFLGGRIHSLRQQKGIGPRLDSTGAAADLIKSLTLKDIQHPGLTIAPDGTITPQP